MFLFFWIATGGESIRRLGVSRLLVVYFPLAMMLIDSRSLCQHWGLWLSALELLDQKVFLVFRLAVHILGKM